jgi:hypothetical protein
MKFNNTLSLILAIWTFFKSWTSKFNFYRIVIIGGGFAGIVKKLKKKKYKLSF